MPGRSARGAWISEAGSANQDQVADDDEGIILDYSVEPGAAPDGPQLAPAVVNRIRTSARPRAARGQ